MNNPNSNAMKENVSGDSTIVETKEISMSNSSTNTASKKILSGLVVGGILAGGITYFANKKYIVSATIIGAIVGAIIYNKYQK